MVRKNNRSAKLLRWTFVLAAILPAAPGRLLAQSDNAAAPGAPAAAPAAQTAPQPSTDQGIPVVIKKESRLVLVDAVVTDKKGNYVRDLTQNDFKVYEDNKEQSISSFSAGTDASIQASGQKRYLILFFDNSTMQPPDQIQARSAANKFIAANANADHLMAVVDFGGALRIVQNFTANADLLRAAHARLATIEPWDASVIDEALRTLADELGQKPRQAFAPIRLPGSARWRNPARRRAGRRAPARKTATAPARSFFCPRVGIDYGRIYLSNTQNNVIPANAGIQEAT